MENLPVVYNFTFYKGTEYIQQKEKVDYYGFRGRIVI